MENRIDDLFRNKLSKFEEAPSQESWEQIHTQLASKRRRLWGRRLAIAASIILIVTIGFVGYRSLHTISVEDGPGMISSTKKGIEAESSPQIQPNKELTEQKDIGNTESETGNRINTQKMMPAEIEPVKEMNQVIEYSEPVIEKYTENKSFLSEAASDNNEPESILENEDSVEPKEMVLPIITEEKPVLTENTTTKEIKETGDETTEVKKKYPQVRIVYKANADSELVKSEKRNILNKGLNKITEFSDEHLLTEDRKTKLRNTKEDLLALNFGKLFNKSNKETEN